MNQHAQTVFIGLSMGGVASLVKQRQYKVAGVLSVDAFPTGNVTDEILENELKKERKNDCLISIISSSDDEDKKRQLMICDRLRESGYCVIYERSKQKFHLGYIPSRLSILIFVKLALSRRKLLLDDSHSADKHITNALQESELWE